YDLSEKVPTSGWFFSLSVRAMNIGLLCLHIAVLSFIYGPKSTQHKAYSSGKHRTLYHFNLAFPKVFIGVSYSCIHARHILTQLLYIGQLRTTSGNDKSSSQLIFIARSNDFSMNKLYDFFHPRLDNVRKVFQRYLFGRSITKPWYRDYFVGVGFFSDHFAKF